MKDNTITAESDDIFEANALKELFPYQADHLRREFRDFLALNKVSQDIKKEIFRDPSVMKERRIEWDGQQSTG